MRITKEKLVEIIKEEIHGCLLEGSQIIGILEREGALKSFFRLIEGKDVRIDHKEGKIYIGGSEVTPSDIDWDGTSYISTHYGEPPENELSVYEVIMQDEFANDDDKVYTEIHDLAKTVKEQNKEYFSSARKR